jgi:heat shock protein HslJ
MKKYIPFFVITLCVTLSVAQNPGLIDETFNLEYLDLDDYYYTPNGENSTITFTENGTITFETFGIENTITGEAVFNGDTVTFQNMVVTIENCTESTCYYEDKYFYDFLTTASLEDRSFTYYYSQHSDGTKYFSLNGDNFKKARFSNRSTPVPNPILFQTWYLYQQDIDLGPSTYFTGPNPPQITIQPDFTYTGIEGCSQINGDLILANPNNDIYDFTLQAQNYFQDTTNCPPGPVGYTLYELHDNGVLNSQVYSGNDGVDYFWYEMVPGFLSHFRNVLILSTPENIAPIFSLYPNPTIDIISVETSEKLNTIAILDTTGRIVLENKAITNNTINVSSLKTGVYFIKIFTLQGSAVKRFIKQ